MTINPTDAIRSLIRQVDPDPDREGLEETPGRYCAALQEWTSGYHVDTDKLLKTFADGGEKYDEMVFVGSIPFYSMCEHHLATFFGVAHVAYIPSTRIVGLSKIPRLVDAFARRLSVQERDNNAGRRCDGKEPFTAGRRRLSPSPAYVYGVARDQMRRLRHDNGRDARSVQGKGSCKG
jgi:hypothetical protein